ncbi:MAG: DUF3887 domain-containing protein [Paraclostridium sordellii]
MKKIKILLCMILVGAIMVGCSSSKLDDEYNEDVLKKDAKNVISMLLDKDYKGLESKMSEAMMKEDAINLIKDAWEPIYSKIGKFKSEEKIAIVGNKGLATVVILDEFENGKSKFTISYNKDMKIEGFFMK